MGCLKAAKNIKIGRQDKKKQGISENGIAIIMSITRSNKKNMIKEIFITQQGVEGEIKLLLKQGIKQMACAVCWG